MSSEPLVSAIMPSRGRCDLATRAVKCFLAQTWAAKELVIVDDLEKPAFPILPSDPGIFYWGEQGHRPVGAKRNLAVSRAHGEIIFHWDSDDYSAPERMLDQITRLLTTACEVTGYHTMLFLQEQTKQAWRYRGRENYALGSSLCYKKDFWRKHPFPPDTQVGEDNWLVRQAGKSIVCVDAGQMMFAREHSDNTFPRKMTGRQWEALAWPTETTA